MPIVSPDQFDAVQSATDLDQLTDAAQRVVELLGFERFMYVMARRDSVLSEQPELFTLGTYHPDYLAYYREQQCFRVDPAARHIVVHQTPKVWLKRDFADAQARAMYQEACRHGVSAGAAFPALASGTLMAGLGIARAGDPDEHLAQTRRVLPYGQLLTIQVHAGVNRLMRLVPSPVADSVTERERECLALAARGLRDPDIANHLGITTRTVLFHLSNARRKLSAENRAQMIAQALALHIIGL